MLHESWLSMSETFRVICTNEDPRFHCPLNVRHKSKSSGKKLLHDKQSLSTDMNACVKCVKSVIDMTSHGKTRQRNGFRPELEPITEELLSKYEKRN